MSTKPSASSLQGRGQPRGPRDQLRDSRVRGRLVDLLSGPGSPLMERGRAGHLGRSRRLGRRDRGDHTERVLAAVPHPLPLGPDVDHPQEPVVLGQGAAAPGVRPTRHRRRARPVRPRPGRPARQAPTGGRAPPGRPRGHPGVRSPSFQGDLAPDLLQQPNERLMGDGLYLSRELPAPGSWRPGIHCCGSVSWPVQRGGSGRNRCSSST